MNAPKQIIGTLLVALGIGAYIFIIINFENALLNPFSTLTVIIYFVFAFLPLLYGLAIFLGTPLESNPFKQFEIILKILSSIITKKTNNKTHELSAEIEGICRWDSSGFLLVNVLVKNLGEKNTTLNKVCLYLPDKNSEFECQEIGKSLKVGKTLPRKEKFNVLHQNSEKYVKLPIELEKNGIIRYYETFGIINTKLKFKKK